MPPAAPPLLTSLPHAQSDAPGFRRKVALIWLAFCVLSLIVNLGPIADLRFPDPDDVLRLIQVRDWIGGQSWFDLHQYRIDPPRGVAMHWTRLVDLPIAGVIVALGPVIGQHSAELAALIAVPLVTLGCVLALVARFARQLFGARAALFACLVVGLSVPLLHQLRPMRIDHHGWQIVMALIALNAAFAASARQGGTVAGLALAGWLAISIEGLPLAAAFMGLFALRWLRNWRDAAWLTHGMAALAAGSAGLWLITHRPAQVTLPFCDAVSGAHLALFGIAAAGCLAASRLVRPARWQQLGALALAAMAGVTAFALLAPACTRGDAFAALDPVVRQFWYVRIYEGLPIWLQPMAEAVETIGLPLLALAALAGWWRQADPGRRSVLFDYGLVALSALCVAFMVERAAAVAAAFAAPAAAALVRQWLDRAQASPAPLRRAGVIAGALAALAPAMPIRAAEALFAPQQAALERQVERSARCELPRNLTGLNALPPARFLTPLDTGPALLYASHHSIAASGHHRASTAMRDVIDAFRGSPESARAIVERRGVEFVAFCPGLYEPMIYQADAPDGLMARLIAGRPPAWLEPVSLSAVNGLQVYRVRRAGEAPGPARPGA